MADNNIQTTRENTTISNTKVYIPTSKVYTSTHNIHIVHNTHDQVYNMYVGKVRWVSEILSLRPLFVQMVFHLV